MSYLLLGFVKSLSNVLIFNITVKICYGQTVYFVRFFTLLFCFKDCKTGSFLFLSDEFTDIERRLCSEVQ